MFRLVYRTPDTWFGKVQDHLDELLVEQAHLEKKAASAAVSYLFRYPQHPQIHRPLSELAREELEHFEASLALLDARGISFSRQKPGPYAGKLLQIADVDEPQRMLDMMLCHAVIEARSCERMKVLAEALRGVDDELAEFWYELTISEARHHGLYVNLAKGIYDAERVERRLDEVLEHEARVLGAATSLPRLHN